MFNPLEFLSSKQETDSHACKSKGKINRLLAMRRRANTGGNSRSRDLLSSMHAHKLNLNQYAVEHDGLDYWLDRDRERVPYDPILMKYYFEPGNSFFRECFENSIKGKSLATP